MENSRFTVRPIPANKQTNKQTIREQSRKTLTLYSRLHVCIYSQTHTLVHVHTLEPRMSVILIILI